MVKNKSAQQMLIGLLLLATLACAVSTSSEEDNASAKKTLEFLYIQETLQALNNQPTDEPLSKQLQEDADLTLGDLAAQNAAVYIPAGAFDQQTEVQFNTLNTPPTMNVEGVQPLGATVSIVTNGGQTRSSQPIQVTLKFDSQGIQEYGEVLVGYYHQDHGWELFPPDQIDLEREELSFVTYHFSEYSALKVDDQVRIDQFIEQRSTEEYVRRLEIAKTSEEYEKMVKAILKEGMNVDDNRVLEIIAKGVIEQIPFGDIPFGDIGIALHEISDDNSGQIDLAKIATENTVKYIGEKTLSDDSPFKEVTGDLGSVIACGEAYVKLLKNKGDSKESLEIMAHHIMSNIPMVSRIYKAGRRAVELARHTRDLWKNQEIEKAFKVYSQGGEGGYLGYSVDSVLTDPDSWNKIKDQNKSSFEKIASDYMRAYCRAEKLDVNQLSETERDRIRAEGLENLRQQFDNRMARRDEIDKIKANNKALMQKFAEKGLLERMIGTNPMYNGRPNEDLEMLMDRLKNMTDRIMRDTGRFEIVNGMDWDTTDPFERDNMIPLDVVVELTYQWYDKDLRFKPDVYDAVIKELKYRLDRNLGWGPTHISTLVKELIEKYAPQAAPSEPDTKPDKKTEKKKPACPFADEMTWTD